MQYIINMMRTRMGHAPPSDLSLSRIATLSVFGASDGLLLTRITVVMHSTAVSMIPGIHPAIKRSPTEVPANIPYIIRGVLGGISIANGPAAAMLLKPIEGLYLYFFISGHAIWLITIAVACPEPHIAPKIALATVLVIARPPVVLPSQFLAHLYASVVNSPLIEKSPININIGSTLSVYVIAVVTGIDLKTDNTGIKAAHQHDPDKT
jgi:hypothetical protein